MAARGGEKPIRLTGHALLQLDRRGTTRDQIVQAIRTQPWQPAELGRLECRMTLAYNATWNKKVYATKQVRPIFVEEPNELVVITVYVYYF